MSIETGLRLLNWMTSYDLWDESRRLASPESLFIGGFSLERGEEGYDLTLDLPGVKKDDLSVKIESGSLVAEATDRRGAEKKFVRKLPEDSLTEEISAKLEDGVLYVHIPFNNGGGTTAIEVS